MARVRDLLYRFRPSGAPGAANAAGVPADRTLEQTAELEPVLTQLSETERDCADILEGGRRDAVEIRARAEDTARSVVAAARSRAAAERAEAAATVHDRSQAQTGSEALASERQVAEVRDRAAQAMPQYVEQVVASVRSLVQGGVPAEDHHAGAT
ncbi:MAG TPA: hypothetical protein VFX53_16460 [Pedococcus sp.]|nr:hypothetical protein [Pedococcus sp.]